MSCVVGVAIGTALVSGRNGGGPISVPGLKVGDALCIVHPAVGGGEGDPYQSIFETVVSVDDELQQTYSYDATANSYKIFFLRSP